MNNFCEDSEKTYIKYILPHSNYIEYHKQINTIH